jgi:hypothetical protein
MNGLECWREPTFAYPYFNQTSSNPAEADKTLSYNGFLATVNDYQQ